MRYNNIFWNLFSKAFATRSPKHRNHNLIKFASFISVQALQKDVKNVVKTRMAMERRQAKGVAKNSRMPSMYSYTIFGNFCYYYHITYNRKKERKKSTVLICIAWSINLTRLQFSCNTSGDEKNHQRIIMLKGYLKGFTKGSPVEELK